MINDCARLGLSLRVHPVHISPVMIRQSRGICRRGEHHSKFAAVQEADREPCRHRLSRRKSKLSGREVSPHRAFGSDAPVGCQARVNSIRHRCNEDWPMSNFREGDKPDAPAVLRYPPRGAPSMTFGLRESCIQALFSLCRRWILKCADLLGQWIITAPQFRRQQDPGEVRPLCRVQFCDSVLQSPPFSLE